jgi:hypothetical protein
MKSKNRSAIEKAWHNTVAQYGRESGWLNKVFGGKVLDPYQFQLDHALGAQTKRKINLVSVKVGEFAVLPMPIELHDLTSKHPLNRTTNPAAFKREFGCPLILWRDFVLEMRERGVELPFGDDIIKAIVEG